MSRLVLAALRRTYGAAVAVDRVDLDMPEGELVALLGPSGCGKTTTLRMVAGFVAPTSGQVMIGGRDVTRLPPYARDTGMVFQGYALFPHMNVAQNVAFGLEMRRIGHAERDRLVADALRLVRMSHLAERRPSQLSGGQQQRVALARALVINPRVFLLDEPLSNLDAGLRAEMRAEIRGLQRRLGLTTLFVTHDQEEALTIADRLVVMDHGRVRQIGTPEEVFERPADLFVAGFLGRCNVFTGVVATPGQIDIGAVRLPCTGGVAGEPAALMVRPQRIVLGPEGVPGRVADIAYLGGFTEWRVATDLGPVIVIAATPAPGEALRALAIGERIALSWSPDSGRLLPPDPTGDAS